MYDQIYKYFDQILSKYQCGFRQSYNTQSCLLMMVEKRKEALDKGGLGGILLMDLSKAFDCTKHDLLISKLAAYGFDLHTLSFVFSYLNERNKEQKYIIPTTPTLIYHVEFRKGQYWVYFFSI